MKKSLTLLVIFFSLITNFEILASDLGVKEITPLTTTVSVLTTPTVLIENVGSTDATLFDVELVINDGSSDVYTSIKTVSKVPLPAGSEIVVNMDDWTPLTETIHSMTATVTVADDVNSKNNTLTANCDVSGTPESDLGVIEITPLTAVVGLKLEPTVLIENLGSTEVTTYDVELVINDGSSDVYSVSKTISKIPIAAGSEVEISMDIWTAQTEAIHTMTATVTLANDVNLDNNSLTANCDARNSESDLGVKAMTPLTAVVGLPVTPTVLIENLGSTEDAFNVDFIIKDKVSVVYTSSKTVSETLLSASEIIISMNDVWTPSTNKRYEMIATVTVAFDIDINNNSMSEACDVSLTPTNDLGIIEATPLTAEVGVPITPTVFIENLGNIEESAFDVEFIINDGTSDVYTSSKTVSEALPAGKKVEIIMDDEWTSQIAAIHTMTTTVTVANDVNLDNNSFTANCDVTVSVEDILSNNIQVYPNPTAGDVFISLSDDTDEELTITVVNMVGVVISKEIVNGTTSNSFRVDLNNLLDGKYFIQIANDKELIKSVKVIKR